MLCSPSLFLGLPFSCPRREREESQDEAVNKLVNFAPCNVTFFGEEARRKMTLDVLEDTLLDLGAAFWAVAVVVTLLVIEVFQLGPHSFKASSKGKLGSGNKIGSKIKRHRHAPVNIFQFRDLVLNFGENTALLYVGDDRLKLYPDGKISQSKSELFTASSQSDGTEVYPPSPDMDNYVLAHGGKEPELAVLEKFEALWDSRDKFDTKYIVLYAAKIPSTHAIQTIADLLSPYSHKTGVSVLYKHDEEGEGDKDWNVSKKAEYLRKTDIFLEKIPL